MYKISNKKILEKKDLMLTIYIDKKKFITSRFGNLLEIFLSLGLNIPYFCWHPSLGSIGSCRQCAVKIYKDETDRIGTIVMSCMTSVLPNMKISVLDSEVLKFRKSIIEFMMLEHPHDCPVCSEGGKCHLQDMTVLNQHHRRRYQFKKRIFKNQFLGPFIQHEMNRCITCYRCVRYYKDYAGGKDFGVYGSSNKIYFGRFKDGFLESEYSGNLVDICPTGVFTEKKEHNIYARKWDIKYTPSICPHCSIGCNISIGERYGKVCVVDNRFNFDINKHFLCDLGRFGYGYLNNKKISFTPLLNFKKNKKKISNIEAIKLIINLKKKYKEKIFGIGSSRASLESNFALRTLVGKKNFFSGMDKKLNKCMSFIIKILKNSNIYIPTITEIETYDVILILGEDLTQTASRAALAVRQAIKNIFLKKKKIENIELWNSEAIKTIFQNKKNSLFITSTDITKLDDISEYTYYAPVEQQIKFGILILECLQKLYFKQTIDEKHFSKIIIHIAQSLLNSKKPLIISGASNINLSLLKIAHNLAAFLKICSPEIGLILFPSFVNSVGVSLLNGFSFKFLLTRIIKEKIKILIILENDISLFLKNKDFLQLTNNIKNIIVIDHKNSNTVLKSTIFLPCSKISESTGTFVNYEARAQRFFKVIDSNFYTKTCVVLESWRWLHALYNEETNFKVINSYTLDEIFLNCIKKIFYYKNDNNTIFNSQTHILNQKILRSTNRFSGRTSFSSNITVHEPLYSNDLDSTFTFSLEGSSSKKENFSHIPFTWSAGWNSIQSLYKTPSYYQKKEKKYQNGLLLLSKRKKYNFSLFTIIPKLLTFKKNVKEFVIFPYYKLLGSEEISQNSKEIKKIIKESYIILNIIDGKSLQLKNYDLLKFTIDLKKFKFPVLFSKKTSLGTIGLPIGIFNLSFSLIGKKIFNLKKVIKT